jgi:small-conductance mechanosensitive channel
MRRNPETADFCSRWDSDPKNDGNSCPTPKWEDILQKILAATTIAAAIYLIEKTIIQLISINYHRKQFNARIKDSKRNIYVLGLLYDASRYLFPMYCQEFAEEDYTIADQLNLSRSSKTPGHTRSGSATPMRIIQNVGAGVDKITSAFGHVAKEVTGKQVFNPNSAHSIVVEALEKNRTAEALAKRIWMSFVVEGRDALLQEDIVDVLGPDAKTEAEEAFWVLDRDGNGDVSLDEMILTVTEFGRERKSIASSMHDVDQAINVLDRLLAVVVFIITILIFVAFLNESFVSTLATTGTALLSLSFVFSVSAQEVLGSCIFLFVKHPYDIGDRVDIGTAGCTNQEQFVVEHISLLFTVFRHVQGTGVGRICQIPNIVLNGLWVENISRSKAMTEQLTIDIAFETSFDDLQILKNELLTFVTSPENSRDYQPTVDVDVLGTSDQSKLSLLVEVKHKSNWANETIRRSRRSKFMCALVSALKVVPIYPPGGGVDVAGTAANPTYTVGITHPEAKEHADMASKGREDARLVPMKKVERARDRVGPATSNVPTGAGLTLADSRVVDDLTSRDPASDPARDEAWTSSREDSSTLGERPSIDRSDLEEVRGLLRRESTRGKRKPSSDYHPTVPTINEPESQPYTYGHFPQSASGYENQRPGYYPPARPQNSQYQSPQQYPASGQPTEMSQVQPQRSPSNPYRQRSNSASRKALRPPRDEEDDDFSNMRPYSGV